MVKQCSKPNIHMSLWTRLPSGSDRCGLGTILLAKFLPGPNLVSPLAGVSGLTRGRFLVLDSIASVIWISGYIAVG